MKDNKLEIATFSGGCFWCTEAIFKRLKGVEYVISGYTGGVVKNPAYKEICTGKTGHAEAIQIHYFAHEISFNTLLEIFFSSHDPTTLNKQGADEGTQYRSGIFYHSKKQKELAHDYINQLTNNHIFDSPIVTEVTALKVFYEAEKEHFDYYDNNQEQRYCQLVITPKIVKLNSDFSEKLKNKIAAK